MLGEGLDGRQYRAEHFRPTRVIGDDLLGVDRLAGLDLLCDRLDQLSKRRVDIIRARHRLIRAGIPRAARRHVARRLGVSGRAMGLDPRAS